MFTGIIEETGTVKSLDLQKSGARITVEANLTLSDLVVGESIAVSGVCLTVVSVSNKSFSADLTPETLERTSLGDVENGSQLNLERPLSLDGRISGHYVQGHVDGTGELLSLETTGDGNWWLRIRVPQPLLRYLAYKGSIAIDGISLTVAALNQDVLEVAVIPHTYQVTSLRGLQPGCKVNLECDLIAKHIERLFEKMDLPAKSSLRLKDLEEQGF